MPPLRTPPAAHSDAFASHHGDADNRAAFHALAGAERATRLAMLQTKYRLDRLRIALGAVGHRRVLVVMAYPANVRLAVTLSLTKSLRYRLAHGSIRLARCSWATHRFGATSRTIRAFSGRKRHRL